jgi:hypothetical protein
MDDSRTLIFMLVLGVFFLINRVLENVGKRSSRAQAPAPEAVEQRPDVDVAEDAPAEVRPRRMKPQFKSQAEREPHMRAADSRFAARIPARYLVSGRENLRRAVIVMTVLGKPAAMRPNSAPPGGAPD